MVLWRVIILTFFWTIKSLNQRIVLIPLVGLDYMATFGGELDFFYVCIFTSFLFNIHLIRVVLVTL